MRSELRKIKIWPYSRFQMSIFHILTMKRSLCNRWTSICVPHSVEMNPVISSLTRPNLCDFHAHVTELKYILPLCPLALRHEGQANTPSSGADWLWGFQCSGAGGPVRAKGLSIPLWPGADWCPAGGPGDTSGDPADPERHQWFERGELPGLKQNHAHHSKQEGLQCNRGRC